jgi:hypothetical protein
MGDWTAAVHYRNRAEMLRKIADETDDSHHRQSLRRAAEYYEKMAAALEAKIRTPAPAN